MIDFNVAASLEACHRLVSNRILKITEDLARYRQIIEVTKPELIIETGTFLGGSAQWFASLGPSVITVDTQDLVAERGASVTYLRGNSVDPAVYHTVGALVAGRRTMVVLDSDHSADHVEQEIMMYGGLVSPGCYLVVEDGILRWLPSSYDGNPLDAVERTLVNDPAWEEMESGRVTLYPRGWWRKR